MNILYDAILQYNVYTRRKEGMMQYTALGRTGMRVSPLCLGTMTFGRETPKDEAIAMIAQCKDRGINFIDTANLYSDGLSESIVGEALEGQRDDWILATKACQPIGQKGPNDRGASRRHLRMQVESSLRRLRTDHIDLFYLHLFDPETCLDETMRALDDLVREGKVMCLGVSNFSAWQTMKANGIACAQGRSPIHVIQPMYSLVKRQAEVELFPMAQSEHLGVVPYSPLGGGLLTGKYARRKASSDARLHAFSMYAQRYAPLHYQETARAFVEWSEQHGYHPVPLAIAWAAAHPAVTAPILGARSREQLKLCLDALELRLEPSTRRALNALSPTPPPATDRLEQQKSNG